MPVSQSLSLSSITLADLPGEVADAIVRVVDFCREHGASPASAEAFETVETGLRDAVHDLGRTLLRAWIESLDAGADRIDRDGLSWYRVAATPKKIMTMLGPVTYRRARYRTGRCSTSLVPVDEGLGLVDNYLTRPAAQLGVMMMGHCTAREAEECFAKMGAMTPSVSTLQRLTLGMHERWESISPAMTETLHRAEDIPSDAVSASVSLHGVMVALRAGEDGRADACWREASCGTVSFHDADGKRLGTHYVGRMPESGKVTLKAHLATMVARIRHARPQITITAVADGAADNWTFLKSLSPETEVIDFFIRANTFAWPAIMRWRRTGSRSTAKSCATTRKASPR